MMMKKNSGVRKSENIIYGVHPVTEAIQAGKELDKVIIQQNIHGEWLPEIRKMLDQLEVPVQYLPINAMNRISRGNHQGIIAFLSPIQYQSIEAIIPAVYESGESPLILVLDRITDVRNLGAIARTAECLGVHALIIPARGSAQINADTIKTSSGALMNIPVVRSMNLKSTLTFLKESGLKIIAASEKAEKSIWHLNLTDPIGLILGSEESGISPEYLRFCDEKAMIPMQGQVASLNVSVAAGMFLYEVTRQRKL